MLEHELSTDLRLHIAVLLMLLLITAGREAAAATSVYECSVDGRQVFSDRPCGSEVKQRDIPEPNRMEAVDTRTLRHESPASSHSRQSNNDPAATRQRAACNRNREQTERIHALMRRGYNAAQGIRYDERLRKLREQYQKQRCERYR